MKYLGFAERSFFLENAGLLACDDHRSSTATCLDALVMAKTNGRREPPGFEDEILARKDEKTSEWLRGQSRK